MKRTAKLTLIVLALIAAGMFVRGDRVQGQGTETSPVIIKRVAFLNKSTDMGPSTLFTPTSNSIYRVTAYADVTPPSNDGVACPLLSWTDEAGTQSQAVTNPDGNACAYATNSDQGVVIIHSIPGQPVLFSMSVGDFSGQYNVFITVEKL